MALANWLANYPREAPGSPIKCSWPISTTVVGRGVLIIVDRSQLNGAFGKAAHALPTAVRDAAGYVMKKITASGDSWNFLLSKGRIVDARDIADLLRCIDTTTEQGPPFDLLRRFVHTHDDGAAVRGLSPRHRWNTFRQHRAAAVRSAGLTAFQARRRCTKRWLPRLVVQGSA